MSEPRYMFRACFSGMKAPRSPLEADYSESDHSATLSKLQSELDGSIDETADAAVGDVVADIEASLFGDDAFEFSEPLVMSSLDDLLVSLVALRTADTHGKQLLEDLSTEFDTDPSPGTVYPRLHELCDAGVLEQRELIRTKEYTIADEKGARNTIADAARQHLALGLLFQATLTHGEFDRDGGLDVP